MNRPQGSKRSSFRSKGGWAMGENSTLSDPRAGLASRARKHFSSFQAWAIAWPKKTWASGRGRRRQGRLGDAKPRMNGRLRAAVTDWPTSNQRLKSLLSVSASAIGRPGDKWATDSFHGANNGRGRCWAGAISSKRPRTEVKRSRDKGRADWGDGRLGERRGRLDSLGLCIGLPSRRWEGPSFGVPFEGDTPAWASRACMCTLGELGCEPGDVARLRVRFSIGRIFSFHLSRPSPYIANAVPSLSFSRKLVTSPEATMVYGIDLSGIGGLRAA